MKRAVIVVGSHYAGKSKTINKYFKPLIGLRPRQRNFLNGRAVSQSIEEREGRVLSQSLEEKGDLAISDFIRKYGGFRFLVCAARPDHERVSLLKKLLSALRRRKFNVTVVEIEIGKAKSYYEKKASEILRGLGLRRGSYR